MSECVVSLDEIENAHVMVGGTERGRRYATRQINYAYAVLLSSQFQGFCRDLHTECADFAVQSVSPAALQSLLFDVLVRDRLLDRGNPNPGNIGADFGRLGIRFWNDVYVIDARNQSRRALLDELNEKTKPGEGNSCRQSSSLSLGALYRGRQSN